MTDRAKRDTHSQAAALVRWWRGVSFSWKVTGTAVGIVALIVGGIRYTDQFATTKSVGVLRERVATQATVIGELRAEVGALRQAMTQVDRYVGLMFQRVVGTPPPREEP